MPASKLKKYNFGALYRMKLTCHIGKSACEGKGVPQGLRQEDWRFYQLFCALEDLAEYLEEVKK